MDISENTIIDLNNNTDSVLTDEYGNPLLDYSLIEAERKKVFAKFTGEKNRRDLEKLGWLWTDVDAKKHMRLPIDEIVKIK